MKLGDGHCVIGLLCYARHKRQHSVGRRRRASFPGGGHSAGHAATPSPLARSGILVDQPGSRFHSCKESGGANGERRQSTPTPRRREAMRGQGGPSRVGKIFRNLRFVERCVAKFTRPSTRIGL
jgi:hypothetical protein